MQLFENKPYAAQGRGGVWKLLLPGAAMSEHRRLQPGFSMVELIVVASIIAILAAIGFPAILRYLRLYEIRASADEIATQIQGARTKAISKNVNLGVIWLMRTPSSSRWIMEDDLNPTAPNWSVWANEGGSDFAALDDDGNAALVNQRGIVRQLRTGIVFDDPAACNRPPEFQVGAGNAWGLRFNRLGAFCRPGSSPTDCPDPPAVPGYPQLVHIAANGTANICLFQARTQLRRLVTVSAGGRVRVERGEF